MKYGIIAATLLGAVMAAPIMQSTALDQKQQPAQKHQDFPEISGVGVSGTQGLGISGGDDDDEYLLGEGLRKRQPSGLTQERIEELLINIKKRQQDAGSRINLEDLVTKMNPKQTQSQTAATQNDQPSIPITEEDVRVLLNKNSQAAGQRANTNKGSLTGSPAQAKSVQGGESSDPTLEEIAAAVKGDGSIGASRQPLTEEDVLNFLNKNSQAAGGRTSTNNGALTGSPAQAKTVQRRQLVSGTLGASAAQLLEGNDGADEGSAEEAYAEAVLKR